MKSTLIAVAGVLAALLDGPSRADDTTVMKESDPMKPGHPEKSSPQTVKSDEMKRVEAKFKSANEACSSQSGAARESCMAEAKKTYEAAGHDAHRSSNERTDPIERAARNGAEAEAKCGEMSGDAATGCLEEAIYKRQ